jgi:hypothetical protein
MLKPALFVIGFMICATVAVLIYAVVVDDPAAPCRDFAMCSSAAGKP